MEHMTFLVTMEQKIDFLIYFCVPPIFAIFLRLWFQTWLEKKLRRREIRKNVRRWYGID